MTERAADWDVKSAEIKPPGKLGGARAEFVASLGKKLKDARDVLGSLSRRRADRPKGEKDAKDKSDKSESLVEKKDELRRRLHALGASAKLLHFDSMAKALAEAAEVLDRNEVPTANDIGAIASVLDELPAMAWGEPAIRTDVDRKPPSEPPPPAKTPPRAALVVGSAMIAEALTDEELGPPYECARSGDVKDALAIVRKDAPDVIVVDEDVSDAAELVEALLDDPSTEGVPVIVLGAKQSAKFTALGVAKAIAKPITPEQLRRACEEAIDQKHEVTMRVTLGEPTIEQLGERLADEVRRAIVESAGAQRSARVPLGEGTEVMSALWGAIARVREVVTARTGGAVRFGATGPEGAIAVAPWLHPDFPGTARVALPYGRTRGPAADVQLHGRRIVVADDDPGVTWFIADLLRTAGCVVFEALDGNAALDLCFREAPEVVISDVLMPGLDGFALTRALKRDVALRDVPVILLSWKEDLLQRVRELGASAAAYLRKESDSRAIVARVRECLRPRARVEARLQSEGEARGRLDGLTPRALLELASAARPNSRVSVRDATFLYEVELRDGAPRRATRSRVGGDGSSVARGEPVIAALLGVGAGRFTVTTADAPIAGEDRDFSGSLAQLLAKPLAIARAARLVTTGVRTVMVEKLRVNRDALTALAASTPEPARSLAYAIADGASPRQLLRNGQVNPALLDDVLGDLAARGAIEAAYTTTGEEVLAPMASSLLAAREAPLASRARPAEARRVSEKPAPVAPAPVAPPPAPEVDVVPSSLADAVIREISERASDVRARSSNPPPIVEPSELRPRSSNPPPAEAAEEQAATLSAQIFGTGTPIPPDAIVPAALDDRTDVDAPVEARANDDEDGIV